MPLRLRAAGALILALIGCKSGMNDNSYNAMVAVEQQDVEAARNAAKARRGLEQRDESGSTPLLKAAASGQYQIAEILFDEGADRWAYNEFGLTVAHYISTNRFAPGTAEGDAKKRLQNKLMASGFPFPPPSQEEVLDLARSGSWPPHSKGSQH